MVKLEILADEFGIFGKLYFFRIKIIFFWIIKFFYLFNLFSLDIKIFLLFIILGKF
jgi:hypothetical protein